MRLVESMCARLSARLAAQLIETGTLSDENEQTLCAAADGRSIDDVRTFLNVADPDALDDLSVTNGGEVTADILFTSLVGSKGLSAEHVFIVGMNNNYFPGAWRRSPTTRSAA